MIYNALGTIYEASKDLGRAKKVVDQLIESYNDVADQVRAFRNVSDGRDKLTWISVGPA